MRVCPKCGYSDNPLWENCRFKRDLQLMRVEDFKKSYPHLAERIESEKYVRDGQFLYHKTTMYVLRKEPVDWGQPFWEHFQAHAKESGLVGQSVAAYYNRQKSKSQRRLFSGGFSTEKSPKEGTQP
jgi:hypothetical protein